MSNGRWGARASEKAGARDLAMDMMATDPPVSEPQRKAMFAAAAGKSTLGIPKKVGEEFVGREAKDAKEEDRAGRTKAEFENSRELKKSQEREEAREANIAATRYENRRLSRDGRWGGRARDSVDTRYRSTDEYNPPFQYERGKRVI